MEDAPGSISISRFLTACADNFLTTASRWAGVVPQHPPMSEIP